MGTVQSRLAALEQNQTSLQAENEALRAQIRELRSAPRPAGSDASVDATPGKVEHRAVSRRGMIAAVAGAAGGLLLTNTTPAAAADGNSVLLGRTNNSATTTLINYSGDETALNILSTHDTGGTVGFRVEVESSSGYGLYGRATAFTGGTRGVYGVAWSNSGTGVKGYAINGNGATYGVYGDAYSPDGYGVYGSNTATTGVAGMALYGHGRLKVTGRSYLGTPTSPPVAGDLDNGSISFYLDQASNRLKVRVKYSTGVLKTATIALT